MSTTQKVVALTGFILAIIGVIVRVSTLTWRTEPNLGTEQTEQRLEGFTTNTGMRNIELSQLVASGAGKDGIRAITQPIFKSANNAQLPEKTRGIAVTIGSETKFYPNKMLVWHEVINDEIGGTYFAVTFCPLCASALVFNREVNGDILVFKTSGFLYQSNLVMFDTATESLWSQVRAESVVGDYTGTKLEVLAMEALELGQVRERYPQALILSPATDPSIDYTYDPYMETKLADTAPFPITVQNIQFKPHEIMYVVPYRGTSVAINQMKLREVEEHATVIQGDRFVIAKSGENTIVTINGVEQPGYYEMWFSWAMHHQKTGIVWEL